MTQLEILNQAFQTLVDPRRTSHGHILHHLSTIVMIAFLAILCGTTSYVGMQTFAICRKEWLGKFLNIDNGIPDSDTIRRCLERLDPLNLAKCLYTWLGVFGLDVNMIHLDGKTIKGSGNYLTKATHVLSAFSSDFGVTLAEMTVPDKDNEITAAKQMLKELNVEGRTVTGDAMFCQRELCSVVVSKGGHYCFAVKGNQPTLLENVSLTLEKGDNIQTDTAYEKGHGRIECREYKFTTSIDGIDPENQWSGLKGVASVTRTVEEKGKVRVETRFYIVSFDDFELVKQSIRDHWSIENGLHWSLDTIFDEDACTVKKDFAPQNLNVLRKTSLTLINKSQAGINSKLSRNVIRQVCQSNCRVIEALTNGTSLIEFIS